MKPGITAVAMMREPQRALRRLREDPDYVADWRAHAGPTVREPPRFPFRRQTVANLKAACWGRWPGKIRGIRPKRLLPQMSC